MKTKTNIYLVVLLAFLVIIFCIFATRKTSLEVKPNVLNFIHEATVGQTHIFVDFATTSIEQTTGLSGQKSLESNQGLLFIFDHPDLYGIWMKDMNFPIDVIWFDSNKQVVFIKENFLPSTYNRPNPEVANPPSQTSYILEVPAGFVQSNQIKVGDSLSF
jgi:uncharacterized membrane protein (UPF0127 family)